MLRKLIITTTYLLALVFNVVSSSAAPTKVTHTIKVTGQQEVWTTTTNITLGDIADITSDQMSDDEAVIALKAITIAAAPAPGQELELSAERILSRLRNAGVNLDNIGYVLPRSITIKSAGRRIMLPELEQAVEHYLKQIGRDIIVERINYKDDLWLAPGMNHLEVDGHESRSAGQLRFTMTARAKDKSETRFTITADIEEWCEIPVASRPLLRGQVIDPRDVVMARLNVNALPRDAAFERNEVIGLEASRSFGVGEVFRKAKLSIPPIVEAGASVTLVYRKGLLEASADGTALDAGALNDKIRVRNSSSRKIINGVVLASGLVEVSQ